MQVTFYPKHPNTFASASLDRTIKIWNLSSPNPKFTLDGHVKGVNCVDYFAGSDKPYLIGGSDDHTVKVGTIKQSVVFRRLKDTLIIFLPFVSNLNFQYYFLVLRMELCVYGMQPLTSLRTS